MDARNANLTRRDSRSRLLRQLQRLVGDSQGPDSRLSSGVAAIDRLLPGGGLRHGMLVEWVGGSGVEQEWSSGVGQKKSGYSTTTPLLHYSTATTLSLLAAREACREGGMLVVVDRQRTFYPPAAAAWGVDLSQLMIVRPASARDQLWAAVQSLRSPAVAAVWTAIERLDDRVFRRLQLAAQAGGTLGLLVRPASAVREPSWADVRLEAGARGWVVGTGELQTVNRKRAIENLQFAICNLQSSFSRRVHIRVLRCRHGRAGGAAWLEIDDTAHEVREMKEGSRLSAVGSRPSLLADSR